jgi:hypothetical protein
VTGDLLTGEGIEAAVDGGDGRALRGNARGDEEMTGNLARAASQVETRHLIYISVIGTDRIPVEAAPTE